MAQIINSQFTWSEFRSQVMADRDFTTVFIKGSKWHTEVTWLLATEGIPFARITWGAGVFQIIRNGKVCGHCMGKGTVKDAME